MSDPNLSIGEALTTSQGLNFSKIKSFLPQNNFKWIEPPISPIGNIFPNEQTYHPLIDSNKAEIASYLFNIQGSSLNEASKTKYTEKVQGIVESSVFIKSRATFYAILVITIISLIINLYTGSTLFYYIFGIGAVLSILYGLYVYLLAGAAGKSLWMDFENDLQSQLNSGISPFKILENYKTEERDTKNRESAERASMNNRNTGFSPSSGLLGAFLGSQFGKK